MPAKAFSASVRHVPTDPTAPRANSVAIIDLRGEINSTAEVEMEKACERATDQNPIAVLLNFGGVDYIDSTGIALIARLLAQARTSGHRLLAYGLSAHYVEIFEITRLAEFIEVHSDEVSALTAAIAMPT
jgi:anti-anti-sigma factor